MDREVELSELQAALSELEYPVDRDAVLEEYGDATLVLADGETDTGSVLSVAGDERFDSAADLESAIRGALPRRAAGESYQSEGEG